MVEEDLLGQQLTEARRRDHSVGIHCLAPAETAKEEEVVAVVLAGFLS